MFLISLALAAGDDGRSWMVVPGVFYSQETQLGGAAYGSVTFPLGEGAWPSTLSSALVYTLANQASFAVWPTLYLGADNAWVISGDYIVSHYPTRFFGVGAGADDAWQPLTRRWVTTETRALRRVTGPLYVGPLHALSVVALRDIGAVVGESDDVALGTNLIPGETGGWVHGLGGAVRQERRDNSQSTRQGTLGELKALLHHPIIGSDYRFVETSLDIRGFYTWPGDWTLAGQWLTTVQVGEVPFTQMAELGGDNVLRGLYQGRFRDHSLTALQSELRFPLVGRLRGAGFVGVGQVFHHPTDLGAHPPRWTAGGGLRWELDAVSHSTVRLDVGAGPDGFGLIVQFGEAF